MFKLRTIPAMLTLVLSSLFVAAQDQQPVVKSETSSGGAITGKVVDESGQPLANATVSVRPTAPNTGAGYKLVATNREGAFEISGLERGDYNIFAAMPGYTLPLREPGAAAEPTYRIGDSATITLLKGAVLAGTVTNANGDPVVLVNVRAQMVRDPAGRRLRSGLKHDRTTDDRGVYRIYSLPPGTYVIMVGGPQGSVPSTGNAYERDVPTYAPSSTRDTAQEITVSAGEVVTGIDIRYRGEQGRAISGQVKGPETSDTAFVLLRTAGEAVAPWSDSSYQQHGERAFVFYGIADGDYQLFAQIYSPTGEHLASEVKQIKVRGADVTGIELTTRLLASIAGRVVLEESKAPECKEKPRLLLTETSVGAWHNDTEAARETPQELWFLGAPVKPDAQGNFVVKNLVAGEYYFAARFNATNWFVQSISLTTPSSAAAKTAGNPIDATRVWTNVRQGDKLSGLTITLAGGAGVLRGLVVPAEGDQVPEKLFVYLAPAERERSDDVLRYYAAPVSPEGNIVLNHIAPGRYWILARIADDGEAAPPTKLRLPHETETRALIRREAEAANMVVEFKPCQHVSGFQLPLKQQLQ